MVNRSLKGRLRDLLAEGELEEVAALAAVRKPVLGTLVALTFDPDPEVVWRAIEAQGMAAEAVAPTHPEYVREHVRRLYWLITEESGAVFWRAPESMAEVAARVPSVVGAHIPIAFHLLETLEEEDLEHFRPGTLWAVGRLAHLAREHLPAILPLVLEALERPDPQARGMAVWCLGQVGETEGLDGRPELLDDEGMVEVYGNRTLRRITVGQLTREVLAVEAAGA